MEKNMTIYVIVLPKYEIIRSSISTILQIADEMDIKNTEEYFKCEERELNASGSKVVDTKEVLLETWYEMNKEIA